MIRTLIEVSDNDEWNHKRKLEETLKLLGFEPKPSDDEVRFRRDLASALRARGLDAWDMVEEYRAGLKVPK